MTTSPFSVCRSSNDVCGPRAEFGTLVGMDIEDVA